MMHILHVSYFNDPTKVTRLAVGCEDRATDLIEKLLSLGYNVWETYEECPERDHDELVEVQRLLRELFL